MKLTEKDFEPKRKKGRPAKIKISSRAEIFSHEIFLSALKDKIESFEKQFKLPVYKSTYKRSDLLRLYEMDRLNPESLLLEYRLIFEKNSMLPSSVRQTVVDLISEILLSVDSKFKIQ